MKALKEILSECMREAVSIEDFAERVVAADVVPVVRCKDCKFKSTPDCAMWFECSQCGGQWSWETNNDYCSYGERRDDA